MSLNLYHVLLCHTWPIAKSHEDEVEITRIQTIEAFLFSCILSKLSVALLALTLTLLALLTFLISSNSPSGNESVSKITISNTINLFP